jgi:hypothetical protein
MDGVVGDVEPGPVLQQVEPGKMDLDRSENPVAHQQHVKGGTLTAEEVNAFRDMLAVERDAVVLRDAGQAPGLGAIRRVFGTASSVPCNWHQATIFFLGSENPADAAMKGKARLMLLAGLVLIVFQVLTAMGVLVGVIMPACKTSKQCGQAGMFCAPKQQRCEFCGQNGPLMSTNTNTNTDVVGLVDCPWGAEETLSGRVDNLPDKCLSPGNKTLVRALCAGSENWEEMLAMLAEGGYPTDKQGWMGTAITPKFIESWCETCVNAVDWKADTFMSMDLVYDSVDAMGALDWTTLVFASYVVGLTIIGELKDLVLCQIAIERLGDKLGQWRHAIVICIFLRRSFFLPIRLGTVASLVDFRGGDSLSVCFNTVAILFMAEADNMAYHFGLAEPQKARMETDGRVVLTTEDSQRLHEIKMVYLPVIIAGIVTTVMIRHIGAAVMGGFAVMGTAEAARALFFEKTKQKPKGVAMALARFVVCLFVFIFVFFEGVVGMEDE